jgi:hypothetical protein
LCWHAQLRFQRWKKKKGRWQNLSFFLHFWQIQTSFPLLKQWTIHMIFTCFFTFFVFCHNCPFPWCFLLWNENQFKKSLVNSNPLPFVKIGVSTFHFLLHLPIHLLFMHLEKLKMHFIPLRRWHKTNDVDSRIGQKLSSWCAFNNVLNP